MTTKHSSTRTCWYYSETHTTEWKEFSDIECEIIEDTFKNQQQEIQLDLFRIDLEHSMMTMKHEPSKQYTIKRIENVPKRLRQERFCSIGEHSPERVDSRSFYNGTDRAKRNFSISWQQEHAFETLDLIEEGAAGILVEGEKLGYHSESQWIANCLLAVKHKNQQQMGELYTRESFLYKLLNKTLRDDDTDKRETLAPFVYLLQFETLFCLFDAYRYRNTVYRAMNLIPEEVNQYEVVAGNKARQHWRSFISTTKNLIKAEFYQSNTLFYISLSHDERATSAIDISTYSYIPDEEEVLLISPFYFRVDSVKYNNAEKRHNIYLTQDVLQQ